MSIQDNLRFNKIECYVFNKYIRKEEGKIVIDYLDEGCNFIRNNKDIICDKIEVLNGIGVLMYYNDIIVKHIDKNFIEIEFDNRFNTITIIDKKSNDRFLYIYYKNDIIPKDTNEKQFSNKKYNIGDKVYPTNIGYYKNTNYDNFNPIYATIFWEYIVQIDKAHGAKIRSMPEDMFEAFCHISAFEIVDKVADKFYKIKLSYIDDDLKGYQNEVFYATDDTLFTLDELKANAQELRDFKEERNN